MSSPSNSGENALLSRIGTVKKMWSSEELEEASSTPNEVVVFFLSFLVLSSFFLPIFYVISASRDTHQNYNRHTPRLGSMIQPPTLIRFCLPSGFQYKHTAAAVFLFFNVDDGFAVRIGEEGGLQVLAHSSTKCCRL